MQEAAHLVAAVVEDERAPVGVRALARVGVLVEVRCRRSAPAPKRRSGSAPGTQSRITPMPRRCRWSTNARKSSGVPKRGGGREVAGDLVAPRAVERVLHHRQQLDVGEAHVVDVGDELVGQLAVGERAVALLRVAPPRAEVHLVDRDRPRRAGRAARGVLDPGGVAPLVAPTGTRPTRSPAAARPRSANGSAFSAASPRRSRISNL